MEWVYKHDIDGSVKEQLVPLIDLNGFIANGWVMERLEPIQNETKTKQRSASPSAA